MTAHWGLPDPAACAGPRDEQRSHFERTYRDLEARLERFCAVDFTALDPASLHARLDEIGRGAVQPGAAREGGAPDGTRAGDSA